MRPLIGITSSVREKDASVTHELSDRYVQAIAEAGGVPVLLPALAPDEAQAVAAHLDGAVFSGGRDIPPDLYGAAAHPHTDTDAAMRRRALFELALARALAEQGKPVLGICLGCQLLNVAFGGTLVQDIPTEVGTEVTHTGLTEHQVTVAPNSLLAQWLGATDITVRSSHHQAVKQVGTGLRVVAWAPDGIVEGIEATNGTPIVGVQWHPETQLDAAHARQLFAAFVRACRARRQR